MTREWVSECSLARVHVPRVGAIFATLLTLKRGEEHTRMVALFSHKTADGTAASVHHWVHTIIWFIVGVGVQFSHLLKCWKDQCCAQSKETDVTDRCSFCLNKAFIIFGCWWQEYANHGMPHRLTHLNPSVLWLQRCHGDKRSRSCQFISRLFIQSTWTN